MLRCLPVDLQNEGSLIFSGEIDYRFSPTKERVIAKCAPCLYATNPATFRIKVSRSELVNEIIYCQVVRWCGVS